MSERLVASNPSSRRYRIVNQVSGLFVPKVEFRYLDEAYEWIGKQLRPGDFGVIEVQP